MEGEGERGMEEKKTKRKKGDEKMGKYKNTVSSRWLLADLSQRRPGFVSGSVHMGLVEDKVALGQLFSEFFGLHMSMSFHRGFILMYHLWDELKARWWPQFIDTVSPQRYEQQYAYCLL
jgi:hypothetical protein